jgi:hypothetical protein
MLPALPVVFGTTPALCRHDMWPVDGFDSCTNTRPLVELLRIAQRHLNTALQAIHADLES